LQSINNNNYSYQKLFKIITENVLFGMVEPKDTESNIKENKKCPNINSSTYISYRTSPPYLPPDTRATENYTLILDLDETLIHHFEVFI